MAFNETRKMSVIFWGEWKSNLVTKRASSKNFEKS